jgi:broad specificity phosphatase PhoE
MELWFETHATSIDNEAGLASGHSDPPLSATGERQALELGERHPRVSTVWCSDLQRSYRTGELAFCSRAVIYRESRLREVDFGDSTRAPASAIEASREDYIDRQYPNGESYRDVCARVAAFLHGLRAAADPQLIIGHRATWYALEHLLAGRDLNEIVSAPWRWQPGWKYRALFS